MGMAGNKGAHAISLKIGKGSFLFVNCHLASGQKATAKRNTHQKKIEKELKIPSRGKSKEDLEFAPHKRVDHVIWTGDMNYRFDGDYKEIADLAEARDFPLLYPKDQLLVQRTLGKAFDGYQEGTINFKPSYKYIDGTDK